MKTKQILLIVLVVAIVVFLIWLINAQNKKQLQLMKNMGTSGNKQGNAAEDCRKNWLCTTTSILGAIMPDNFSLA